MSASFSVHFDGDITINHMLPVRVLGKTYSSMQSAIDRAYLINKYGKITKYAKLKSEEYIDTAFIASYPREGGIWLDSAKEAADSIIDSINSTLAPLFEKARTSGKEQIISLSEQIINETDRSRQLAQRIPHFDQWSLESRDEWAHLYSNRSIAKEIDQLVSQITIKNLLNSVVEIQLYGSQSYPIYTFNKSLAKSFHRVVSKRELGPPVRIDVRVTILDRGHKERHPGAKAVNISNDKEFILHLPRPRTDDYSLIEQVHQIHDGGTYQIYASPIMEAGGFDINRGDYVFLGISNG